MTDHAQTIAAFLNTDLYRLEAALADRAWTPGIATRLHNYLHRLIQLIILASAQNVPALAPIETMDDALETLHTLTEMLIRTTAALSESHLQAPVLNAYERNLTLLGYLYDHARLSAMLVEWSQNLSETPTVDDWFQEPEE